MDTARTFDIFKVAVMVVIELLLIAVHSIIYTEAANKSVSPISENPAFRLFFVGDPSTLLGGDFLLFIYFIMGTVTVLAAVGFFYFLDHIVHRQIKFSEIYKDTALAVGAITITVIYAACIFLEFTLFFERLLNLQSANEVNAGLLQSLGLPAPSEDDQPNQGAVFFATIIIMLVNAFVGWVSARILHGFQAKDDIAAILNKGK